MLLAEPSHEKAGWSVYTETAVASLRLAGMLRKDRGHINIIIG